MSVQLFFARWFQIPFYHGTFMNCPTQSRFTALIRAAQEGHTSCVCVLVDHGAALNFQERHVREMKINTLFIDSQTILIFGLNFASIWMPITYVPFFDINHKYI